MRGRPAIRKVTAPSSGIHRQWGGGGLKVISSEGQLHRLPLIFVGKKRVEKGGNTAWTHQERFLFPKRARSLRRSLALPAQIAAIGRLHVGDERAGGDRFVHIAAGADAFRS